jgi:kynurenine 3-monooxygenase
MTTLPWDDSIAIIGGGPAGACLAALLAARGFSVDVYEKRPDPRAAAASPGGGVGGGFTAAFGQAADAAKRSINLALSHRGLSAIGALGLRDAALAHTVPMPCRAIHESRGGVVCQAYGQPGEAIFSASRGFINELLLDACAAHPGRIRLHFSVAVRALGEDGVLSLAAAGAGAGAGAPPLRADYRPRLVVGADGAFSAVRGFMLRWTRMDFSRRFIEHGYKELSLPAAAGGGWALPAPHALHIWPRNKFMLIALPNVDKSFTCTLFAPFATFEELDAAAARGGGAVADFFGAHFGDVAALFVDLPRQWAGNPTSPLMEVRCAPWAHASRVVLIGDAAHSTVPFYGQGMNAALEDALCLAEAVDAEAARGGAPFDALSRAVAAFAHTRQPAGIALCDLSMGNYEEMREKTASPLFRARLALERLLHWAAPAWWVPQYSLVAFSRVPYDEVVRRSRRQDAALGWAVAAAAATVAGAVAAAALAASPRARGALWGAYRALLLGAVGWALK